MKRDMELCRKILLKIEENPERSYREVDIPEYTSDKIAYNLGLLIDSGCVEGVISDLSGNTAVRGLTWKGHDFLDKIREDTVWHKTKELVKQSGLPMILNVIESIASTVIDAMTKGAIMEIMKKGGV